MSDTLYCANHPDRETLLRCGKCGQPICTECAVRHPVGLRCPQCARVKKAPTYDVPSQYYLLALGAGLGASLLCSVFVEVLRIFLSAFFLSFLLALGAGAIIGEGISRAAGYKRGRGLQVVAAISVLVGTVAGTLILLAFRFGLGSIVLLPPPTILSIEAGLNALHPDGADSGCRHGTRKERIRTLLHAAGSRGSGTGP